MSYKLSQTNELLEQLPPENRVAIVGLIDLKTDNDMDKVLAKLNTMEIKFDAKFEAIDAKFEAIDAKFEAIDAKFESMEKNFDMRLNAMDSKFEAKFQIVFWALGIIATTMLGIAIKLFTMSI